VTRIAGLADTRAGTVANIIARMQGRRRDASRRFTEEVSARR
jgi:hypothetical protein